MVTEETQIELNGIEAAVGYRILLNVWTYLCSYRDGFYPDHDAVALVDKVKMDLLTDNDDAAHAALRGFDLWQSPTFDIASWRRETELITPRRP